MTEKELQQLCAAHGYTAALVQPAGRKKARWQATSHDAARRTVYLCVADALDTMTSDDIVSKLRQHCPRRAPLRITRLPDGSLELLRGDRRARGTIVLVLDADEQRRVLEALDADAQADAQADADEQRRDERAARLQQLARLRVPELRNLAKEHGIKVPARLRREQLEVLILKAEGLGYD